MANTKKKKKRIDQEKKKQIRNRILAVVIITAIFGMVLSILYPLTQDDKHRMLYFWIFMGLYLASIVAYAGFVVYQVIKNKRMGDVEYLRKKEERKKTRQEKRMKK